MFTGGTIWNLTHGHMPQSLRFAMYCSIHSLKFSRVCRWRVKRPPPQKKKKHGPRAPEMKNKRPKSPQKKRRPSPSAYLLRSPRTSTKVAKDTSGARPSTKRSPRASWNFPRPPGPCSWSTDWKLEPRRNSPSSPSSARGAIRFVGAGWPLFSVIFFFFFLLCFLLGGEVP